MNASFLLLLTHVCTSHGVLGFLCNLLISVNVNINYTKQTLRSRHYIYKRGKIGKNRFSRKLLVKIIGEIATGSLEGQPGLLLGI